jgi:CheY-like chemotaxis protein
MIHRFFRSSSAAVEESAETLSLFVIDGIETSHSGTAPRGFAGVPAKNRGTALAMGLDLPHMTCSVLFVSHNADLRSVARRVLERAGCRVTVAAHAGHASLACAAGSDPFDVLVIEHDMRGELGRVIADRLRRYCPGMGILQLCDRHTAGDVEGRALVRPFIADDLIAGIAEAVAAAQTRRGATAR